jgi:hypothetical protein
LAKSGAVISREVAAEDRFEQHKVPVIRIGRSAAGIAAPERNPVLQLKRGQAAAEGLPGAAIGPVRAAGDPDFIAG